MLTPMMTASNALFGGLLLLAIGLYQLSPIKRSCLGQCRQPVEFITRHWHPGNLGALRIGVEHGAYCLGCCWLIIGLLFYGGVMNLYWIAGIAIYVLVEKLIPRGHWLEYTAGAALSLAGLMMLSNAI